jgi:hypothetical protein
MKNISIIIASLVLLITPSLLLLGAIEQQGTAGVPIDGGLLAVLAAAGITYFAARKKKNAQ